MTVAKAPITFEIDRYADFSVSMRWLVGPTRQSLAPKDLIGWTGRCEIRQSPDDADPIVSVSTTPGAQGSMSIDTDTATVTVTINRTTTGSMTSPLQMGQTTLLIDPDGNVVAFASGPARVTPGYAR